MRARVRGLVVLAAKLLVAAALIAWLVRAGRLDLRPVLAVAWTPLHALVAILGVASAAGGLLFMARRLQVLLSAAGLAVPYGDLVRITMFGSFAGALLPGVVGGDVVKAAYLCERTGARRVETVLVVAADRIVGVIALFLLASPAVFLGAQLRSAGLSPLVLWIGPLAAVGSLAVVGLLALWPGGRGEAAQPVTLWDRVRRVSGLLLASPRAFLVALGLSIVNHASVVVTFVCFGILLGRGAEPLVHFTLDPLAMVANMVPLTPGGIGMAEGVFSLLYSSVGISEGAVIGLGGRLLQYAAFAVTGVPAWILTRYRATAAAAGQAEKGAGG